MKTCFVRSQDNDQAPSSIQYPFYSENFLLSLDGTIRYGTREVLEQLEEFIMLQGVLAGSPGSRLNVTPQIVCSDI